MAEDLNSGRPRANPASGRVEDLNPGPPDYKTSALNHSASVPPVLVQRIICTARSVVGLIKRHKLSFSVNQNIRFQESMKYLPILVFTT